MEGSKLSVRLLIVVFLIWCGLWTCHGTEVSVACMMAYDQGGAPAVFASLECPLWISSMNSSTNPSNNCDFAVLQGWREYQEDRVVCNLAINVPLLGNDGLRNVKIHAAAVFDGHGGSEASDLAADKFLDCLVVHAVFSNYKQAFLLPKDKCLADYRKTTERPLYEVLEEAMLKTFKDIDLEFSQKALENGYISGSTGTVVLLVDGQVLVGHVGDSKAILCSHRINTHHLGEGVCGRELYAEELTRDHHPDLEDEKARIEAAGGFVRWWGVPRVNGILAMSRSIGDVPLKRYGVTAEPEISWRTLTMLDSYLIVGSDGIYERMNPNDVCNLFRENICCNAIDATSYNKSASCSSPSRLAKRIVNAAFESGSTDNLSAVVISLEHYLSS